MKKRNQTAHRQLSSNDLRGVKGGLLPRGAQFDLDIREVRRVKDKQFARIWQLTK